MKKKKTVGHESYDLLQKPLETTDPIEQMREQLSEYDKNLFECITSEKNKYLGDFYIVVITKKERLMPNVLRNYFLTRHSCPTPDYDQTLYRYNRKKEEIEFLWCIPDKYTCHLFLDNILQIDESERELRDFILKFQDGSLYELSKKLNGEIKE